MEKLSGLPLKEVYRYLGYDENKHELTDQMRQLVAQGMEDVLRLSEPRTVCSPILPLRRDGGSLFAGELMLPGKDIEAHLEHCTGVIFMAATLGVRLDQWIRRTEMLDMAKAVILDAAANTAIEKTAQAAEEELRQKIRSHDQYLTMRYSPGYGDFPIGLQQEVLRLTDAPRKIGLSVTPSFIMIPRKSITAVMGVADIDVKGRLAGCRTCVMNKKCIYRKRGTTCE